MAQIPTRKRRLTGCLVTRREVCNSRANLRRRCLASLHDTVLRVGNLRRTSWESRNKVPQLGAMLGANSGRPVERTYQGGSGDAHSCESQEANSTLFRGQYRLDGRIRLPPLLTIS